MLRPWLIVIITTVLISSTVTPTRADELTDSYAKQREIEQAQDKALNKLKNLQFSEEKKKEQLKEISSQINIAKAYLTNKELQYTKATAALKASEKELLAKQKELENRQEALRKRVRGMYQEGTLNYLDLLFQATDLGDFITRLEYFDKLIKNS
ncbi:MAG: hypothetical protein M0T74_15895 [Desulfitobacterium hafniense]|nr:hypothetical protein [Desulfitobacterium hafniense]